MRRCAFLVVCTIGATACSRAHPPRKTHLARLPTSVGQIAIADDGRSYAYFERGESDGWVVENGVKGPTFPLSGLLTFAPVTHALFYFAGNPADPAGDGFLIADGQRLGGQFAREGDMVFSPDGKRWATTGGTHPHRKGDQTEPGPVIVFSDGKELGRYPDASLPAFSHDGKHLAYLVAGDDGAAKLLVDGAERATYGLPESGCSARTKPRVKGKNPEFWPQFQVRYLSDDSLLVMTRDREGWGIYRDATRIASFESSRVQAHPEGIAGCASAAAIASWSLTAAEKAPVVAWFERLGGSEERWRVVVDGKPVDDVICAGAYLRQPPELSADGRHIAYACPAPGPDESFFVVADGQRYGPYRDVWAYVWSDDAAHLAYGGSTGLPPRPWRYYVDGQARSEEFAALWRPRFEPRTGRLAWEAELERRQNGWLGIDGRRIASFDEVVWGPEFFRRGTATWVIRRGRRLTRLDIPTG